MIEATYQRDKMLCIRKEPSTEGEIIGFMEPNESAEVLEVADGWCKIDDGYIMESLVVLTDEERETDVSDSREKLEADVREITMNILIDGACMEADLSGDYSKQRRYNPSDDIIDAWAELLIGRLDRQAAITEREVRLRELYKFEANHRGHIDSIEEVNRQLNERSSELQVEVYELEIERDKLKAENAKLEAELDDAEYDCRTCGAKIELKERVSRLEIENAKLREKLSKALDYAHAIWKLGEL